MIAVLLEPDGEHCALKLQSYLGTKFQAYRSACAAHGGRYRPGTEKTIVRIDAIGGLLADLAAAQIPIALDERVRARVEEAAQAASKLREVGKERVERSRSTLERLGMRLFRYQEIGIEWLAPRRTALLGDDMGLGKTMQTLLSLPDGASAIVVAPLAICVEWVHQTRRLRPDLRARRVAASDAFRWPLQSEVIAISYGSLPADAEPELEPGEVRVVKKDVFGRPMRDPILEDWGIPPNPTHLILDEAHLVKSAKTNRTKRVRALAKTVIANGGSVWLLTGTPLLNRENELWTVLETAGLGKDAFGTFPMFRQAIANVGQSSTLPEKLQRVMLRRRKDDVLTDLPPKRRTDLEVELDTRTASLCDELLSALKEKGMTADDLFGAIRHPLVFEMISKVRAAVASAKIPTLIEMVEAYEDAEKPLVVFSEHRAPIDTIGKRIGWATITGETKPEDRKRIVDEFQAGRLRGVAGTIKAMGVGVTLTRASEAIMVDLAWTPAMNAQAEDRLRRIGQRSAVLIQRLVANHEIDIRVIEILTKKQELIDGTVERATVDADRELASIPDVAEQQVTKLNSIPVMSLAEMEHLRSTQTAQTAAAASVATTVGSAPAPAPSLYRQAKNETERWAADGVRFLAGVDSDRAAVRNGIGFSKFDNDFGHSLATRLRAGQPMSERQWESIVKLARRYRRQLGAEPTNQA